MTALIVIIAIIAIILIYFISVYNSFVKLRNQAEESSAGIDVHLKQRYDLIPNLVETVKGYMAHESDTLAKVTELRTSWANAKTVDEKAKVDNELSSTLKTIMAVAEAYPDLKANQNFSNLQAELSETEDKIIALYNDTRWLSFNCVKPVYIVPASKVGNVILSIAASASEVLA